MDSVLIVVLNWNGIADTEACLASLDAQTYANFSIVLVDNGSIEPKTSERLGELQAKYPNLQVIRNPTNRGFAGGVNTGIRHGLAHSFDYIALFNNDATAEPDWLQNLVDTASRQASAITTGLLLHEDGRTIDSTGDWYSIWGLPFPRARNLSRSEAPPSGPVFGGSGGATLYTSALFKTIGEFDETFFAYYEDVDVSFRARLAGFSAYYTADAVAYHKQGASSSRIPGFSVKQTMKNLPLLYIKNVPSALLLPVGRRFWLAYGLILAKALLSRNAWPALTGYVQGCWYFWTRALPRRLAVQKTRTVTTDHIAALLWQELPPDQTGLRRLLKKAVR